MLKRKEFAYEKSNIYIVGCNHTYKYVDNWSNRGKCFKLQFVNITELVGIFKRSDLELVV